MKTEKHTFFNGTVETKFTLELSDFDYLKDEFSIVQGSIGFDLTSIKDDKLSIHIGSYEIKYDRDVSSRGLMIATERVYGNIRLFESIGNDPHDIKSYLPKTSDELAKLVDEFKYRGLGNTKIEEIKNFLQKN
jgi:hypothetical protein